jgi:quinol---cytochrome c reductase iron-sulfur subunit, bacillus type
VSWPAVVAGVIITVLFGFLWVREATREYRGAPAVSEPVTAPDAVEAHEQPPYEDQVERFPRNVFLELSTLGLGALIGGIVTVPLLGFAVLPGFVDQHYDSVDVGPIENFPEGQFIVTTFFRDPKAGEVSRRTAYIRNNGELDGELSFTIISNRCAHLGCPVQPNGLIDEKQRKEVPVKTAKGRSTVALTPVEPSGFGCPCHGGQYDTEGNRTAGPPVRALDRYEYSLVNGNLVLNKPYSVAKVIGTKQNAVIKAYRLTGPGQHVDGIESWLYPIQPPGR